GLAGLAFAWFWVLLSVAVACYYVWTNPGDALVVLLVLPAVAIGMVPRESLFKWLRRLLLIATGFLLVTCIIGYLITRGAPGVPETWAYGAISASVLLGVLKLMGRLHWTEPHERVSEGASPRTENVGGGPALDRKLALRGLMISVAL